MPDTSKFKTAHQLAKDLLAGPDVIVVIPTPAFDMPGCFIAFPARVEYGKVDDLDTATIVADVEALPNEEPAQTKPPENEPGTQGQS